MPVSRHRDTERKRKPAAAKAYRPSPKQPPVAGPQPRPVNAASTTRSTTSSSEGANWKLLAGLGALLVVALLVYAAWPSSYQSTPQTVNATLPNAEKPVKGYAPPTDEPAKPTPTVTELKVETIKEGTGASPKEGQTITVHYTGRLMDGTKFDSSLDRNQPFETVLQKGMLIDGWVEGMKQMKVGGKYKLTVPADLAYGPRGNPPTIPPNAPLQFEIELLNVK